MHNSKIWRVSFCLVAVIVSGFAAYPQTSTSAQPVARLEGQPIYEEDLLPLIGGQLRQLKNQEYELKMQAVTKLADQRLLEAEARKSGLSADAFLEKTVDQQMPAWSMAELEGYLLAQRDRIKKPMAEIRPQLEQAFIQAKRQQARQEFLDQLRQKAGFTILLSAPRVDVAADPSRLRGNKDAPVTILEFADFQCPYCQEAQKSLKAILEKYKDNVRLGFRDFPLRQIHAQAEQAAEASRCAADEGKFWEFHDLLYANPSKLNSAGLAELAALAGLDVDKFRTCLTSEKFKMQVENDLQLGIGSGVTGTPAFYINGLLMSGSQPVSAFEKIIDSELAKQPLR